MSTPNSRPCRKKHTKRSSSGSAAAIPGGKISRWCGGQGFAVSVGDFGEALLEAAAGGGVRARVGVGVQGARQAAEGLLDFERGGGGGEAEAAEGVAGRRSR